MPQTTPSTRRDPDGEDVIYLRTEDDVCFLTTSLVDHLSADCQRGFISACGFGSNRCKIERSLSKDEPANMSHCSFTVENALSVRALHEMVSSNRLVNSKSRRTLLYGHAILLKHKSSQKYLCCLHTVTSTDKLAFDVGLGNQPEDESCWFTIHPSSKQRSEGEKVRAGDDVILVSVSSERFLHVDGDSLQVSFQQSVWTVQPVCSGRQRSVLKGYLHGGAVVRFFHCHANQCLTAPRDASWPCNARYEGGSMNKHARSLWLIETMKKRWSHGFIQWGQPVRIKSLVSGKYLTLNDNSMRLEVHPTLDSSVFVLTQSEKDNTEFDESKYESMGEPSIRVGDSVVFVRHKSKLLWLGHQVQTGMSKRQKRGRGLHYEKAFGVAMWHMDFGFTLTRAGEEEHRAADVMRISTRVIKSFRDCVKKMDEGCIDEQEELSVVEAMREMQAVQDGLLLHFAEPDSKSDQDSQQTQYKILKMRQDLFREQGMIGLLLETTERLSQVCNNAESGPCEQLLDVVVNMYTLLAAVIQGNRVNCSQFAHARCLDWLFKRLSSSARKAAKGTLQVLHCVLTGSPEALNMITNMHIKSLVIYLEKNGRDEKVLDVLSSLCVWNNVAVRDNQNLIRKHLLPKKGILLKTFLVDHIETLRANVFLGVCEGAASYPRWYFEMAVLSAPHQRSSASFFRVGWANIDGFKPFFGGGGSHCYGGVGDDFSSVGFDGEKIWVGGHSVQCSFARKRKSLVKQVMSLHSEDWTLMESSKLDSSDCARSSVCALKQGDVVGCLLDLVSRTVMFTVNGKSLSEYASDIDTTGTFCPVLSMSADFSCSLKFGENFGSFSHSLPNGYSPACEAIYSNSVCVERFVSCGNMADGEIEGLPALMDYSGYVPAPVDTSNVELPSCVELIKDQLAENIHEVWAVNKIDQGFAYGPKRDDDLKHNPCLKPFDELTDTEKAYDVEMAFQTLRTLLALGYQIGIETTQSAPIPKLQLDQKKYTMSNGYRPQPLDLFTISKLPRHLEKLVDLLAKNAHDVWASARISEGWTYGRAKDGDNKRNPLLVPYEKLSHDAQQSNKSTAYESVRTLLAFGYVLQPTSTDEQSVQDLGRELSTVEYSCRTYRCQYTSAVSTGKWYFEVKMVTNGYARVGWALAQFQAGQLLGSDRLSYAFDGYLARKWHGDSENFGRTWAANDIIGCLLDLKNKTMEFTVNGSLLTDQFGLSVAFDNLPAEAFVPAVTLGMGQKAKIILGHDLNTLQYYNHVGLQEGYEPFCRNMTKAVPVWYSRNLPEFQDIALHHPRLQSERVPFSSPKCSGKLGRVLKLQKKNADPNSIPQWEYIRLNMCVSCGSGKENVFDQQHSFDVSALQGLDSSDLGLDEDATEVPCGQFSFSIRIFPGQLLSEVEVGWVTAGFHSLAIPGMNGYRCSEHGATLRKNASSGYNLGGNDDKSGLKVREAYMCKLSSLCCSERDRPISRELVVHCVLDTKQCMAFFRLAECGRQRRDSESQSMKVLPGTTLFPACFILSSGQRVVQFQFDPAEGCEPLAAAMISTVSDCSVHQCPPRFQLQSLEECSWVRMQDQSMPSVVTTEADGARTVSSSETAKSVVAVLLEQEKAIDLLELVEQPALLSFHAQSLALFSAMSSHGNIRVTNLLQTMFDTDELMWCATSGGLFSALFGHGTLILNATCKHLDLPGPLRSGYYDLLISLHLEAHASARELVKHEFIIPLTTVSSVSAKNTKRICTPAEGEVANHLGHFILSTEGNHSCLQHTILELNFPIAKLKCYAMNQIESMLQQCAVFRRDLCNQARVDFFVPVLKLIDRLLVIDLLTSHDLERLLIMLDPETFLNKDNQCLSHGLIALAVQEPVKLQIVQILQHLCDMQVRRKIESIVEFGKDFIRSLQVDQEQRLTAIKKSSKYSPSVTAKKTREFRMAPSEQMDLLLDMFHNEVEWQEGRKLASHLQAFHEFLVMRCLLPVDKHDVQENKSDHQSWSSRLVERLREWKKVGAMEQLSDHHEIQCTQALRGFIAQTMMNWAKQDIKDPQLTQEVFSLLYRQYDGVGEVYRDLTKAYVVMDTRSGDIIELMESLGQVLSLLHVRMGPDEEEILRDGLKNIALSTLFFQHPDLIRSLGVHEAVLNILKNILGTVAGGSRLNLMERKSKASSPATVAACCKFLITFCRTSRQNQRAIFEHLEFLLQHCGRASCYIKGFSPLCVAVAAVRESQELALALRDSHIETVVGLLATAAIGLPTTNSISSLDSAWPGSSDKRISRSDSSYSLEEWSPKECERFLDFLRHSVWVNGQTVEENASLVVRSLIRRPECLGPALESDGQGVLQTIEDANEEAETYFRRHIDQFSAELEQKQESQSHLGADCDDFYMSPSRCSPILEEEERHVKVKTVEKTTVQFAEEDKTLECHDRVSESSTSSEHRNAMAVNMKRIPLLPDHESVLSQNAWDTASESDLVTPFSPKPGIDFSFLRLVSSQCELGPTHESSEEPISLETMPLRTVLKRETSHSGSEQETRKIRFQQQSFGESLNDKSGIKDDDKGTNTLNFYGSLIDLLGRCASVRHGVIQQGSQIQNQLDSVTRLHSILKSLIPLDDLLGILKIPFNVPIVNDCTLSLQFVGINPQHKAAVLLFLDRVYGAGNETTLVQLLELSFLPDIRVAITLGMTADFHSGCVMLLNRYIFASVLPLLTVHAQTFHGQTKHIAVIDALLHTCYHLSRSQQLTARQRQKVADFLVAFTDELNPSMMQRLMRKLVHDVQNHSDNAVLALRVIHQHYVHFKKYYGVPGQGATVYGLANSEEKHMTMTTFAILVDALHKQNCDESDFFSTALNCLFAVGCALAPDYTLQRDVYNQLKKASVDRYTPSPSPAPSRWNEHMRANVEQYAERAHDDWSHCMIDSGWVEGSQYDEMQRCHPSIKPFSQLPEDCKQLYRSEAIVCIEAMFRWGWDVHCEDHDIANEQARQLLSSSSSSSLSSDGDKFVYSPQPVDLTNVVLPQDLEALGERLAEFLCESRTDDSRFPVTACREGSPVGSHSAMARYDMLLEKEKISYRNTSHRLLKFLLLCGYKIKRAEDFEMSRQVHASQSLDRRFAYWLLQWVIQILDQASTELSHGIQQQRLFGPKVIVPLLTSYLETHYQYFSSAGSHKGRTLASQEEKALILKLLCTGVSTIRENIHYFIDKISSVNRYHLSLIKSLDIKFMLEYTSPDIEMVWKSFFSTAAQDLAVQPVGDMETYVFVFLIPNLGHLYYHIGKQDGQELINEYFEYAEKMVSRLYRLGKLAELGDPSFYSVIGETLGSMALAMPTTFLETKSNMPGMPQLAFLLEELEVVDVKMSSAIESQKETSDLSAVTQGTITIPNSLAVIVPLLCSYMSEWWCKGPSALCLRQGAQFATCVDSDLVDTVLGHILSIASTQFYCRKSEWIVKLTTYAIPLVPYTTICLVSGHFLPVIESLHEAAESLLRLGETLDDHKNPVELEAKLIQHYNMLIRDLTSLLNLLLPFIDHHKDLLKEDEKSLAMKLFTEVGAVFHCWFKSPHFRREYQTYLVTLQSQDSADNQTSNGSCTGQSSASAVLASWIPGLNGKLKSSKEVTAANRGPVINPLAHCLKTLLPICMESLTSSEKSLVQDGQRLILQNYTEEDLLASLEMTLQCLKPTKTWHKVSRINQDASQDIHSDKICNIVRALHHLHHIEHPIQGKHSVWKRIVSAQKKRAVMRCFLMVPLYKLPLHRAINLFLSSYRDMWLKDDVKYHAILIDHLTQTKEANEALSSNEMTMATQVALRSSRNLSTQAVTAAKSLQQLTVVSSTPYQFVDPLSQLVQYFTRAAASEQLRADDVLYTSYGEIMSQSCGTDEDLEFDEQFAETSFQEQEREKRLLLKKQSNLSARGSAQMVIMMLSECSGQITPVTLQTLHLGISLLRGGNPCVQSMMLEYLTSRCDVGFFNAVSCLITACSVLDLDAYERHNRAETLGLSKEDTESIKAMSDSYFTLSLFRFLQLLCEGHNDAFQNMLRTQAGNTTTVNIVICTVDYLLRLQESISDFYWHYSAREMIDPQGRESLSRSVRVAKQVCRTLTEYVQGPCVENQLALAYSRLWDTVGGFFHVFAKIMNRLSQDVSQLELLRELLKLQKELVILLLGLLEGNECPDVIGKQMVDTLEESFFYLEEILRFFDMFIRLNDIISSTAFKEFDTNQDGWISSKEFERAMQAQNIYNKQEIKYLMNCADVNKDGKLDYMEFTERFYVPAKDIGFSYAMLLTNLSEHLPNDNRLSTFRETWKDLLSHFEPCLGRIEIMGQSGRVERLYFDVKMSRRQQWMEPQIQESKRAFLHSVNRASQKEKLQEFVSFCEDTIFEMEHAASISDTEQQQRLLLAEKHLEMHQTLTGTEQQHHVHLHQERHTWFPNITKQLGRLAWIKFLFYVPLIVLIQFGRSILKKSRNMFLDVYGHELLVRDNSVEMVSHLEPNATHSSRDLSLNGNSSVRHRTVSKSLSIPFVNTSFMNRSRNISDSETVVSKISRLAQSTLSSDSKAVDASADKATVNSSSDSVRPTDKLVSTTANVEVEVVGASHITAAVKDVGRCLSLPSLKVPLDLTRSVSDPTGGSLVDAATRRRHSMRRQSTGVELIIPVGILASDPSVKRPVIRKRQSIDEQNNRKDYARRLVATRQFSQECSAALIARRRRQSVSQAVFLERSKSVITEEVLQQNSVKKHFKNDRPLRRLSSPLFGVEEESVADQKTPYIPKVAVARRKFLAMFSRSYYHARDAALVIVFAINLILLFYKAISEHEGYEALMLDDSNTYLIVMLNILSRLHFVASISILIGYVHLKIPLVIFKYEKYVARELEFHGTWIAGPPNSWTGYWHWLLIQSRSFPVNYWDKMVKQRVLKRYSQTLGQSTVAKILNLEDEDMDCSTTTMPSRLLLLIKFDWRYHLWTLGVVCTDRAFLYNFMYMAFSALGNWNHFFFSVHLLDIVMGFKLLRTVLQSVTLNWKQLLLTFMMTVVVVYIYTVLAFNFFRKFYVKEVEQGVRDAKCQDMMTCFVFHLHRGLRAGGGIGDEIEDAHGDDYETFRIIFDITFFFVVIVILLAIIQGLIIDSFGELRDRAEDVQTEMETKCFVCGISKDQFDKIPHGFESHVTQEHNMANYMFFLMYLINKPETEYTGQESYVWKLYQARSWDFFPVGDCFRFRQEKLLDSTTKPVGSATE